MAHHGEEEAWDSEAESVASSTSTPSFKRGNHEQTSDSDTTQQIHQQIQQESCQFMEGRRKVCTRGPSLHILADSRIQNWPKCDNICVVDFRPGWSFKQWISALRAEMIRVKCNTVVLYLEKVHEFEEVPLVKNALHTICWII